MALNFFGRGSGFSKEHTAAYFFTEDRDLVLIDCSITTINKLKLYDSRYYNRIYVLITHTHGDHVGALGLLVQYVHFTLKKSLTVVAPSGDVALDISTLLTIEGNHKSWYELVTAFGIRDKSWFGSAILTEHSPQLKNKCFGYNLVIDEKNIVYTGDTCTLQPFMPYLVRDTILYVDTSVYYGEIHLKLEDALNDFIELTKKGVKVYLMHLDDERAAEKMITDYPDIELVSVN